MLPNRNHVRLNMRIDSIVASHAVLVVLPLIAQSSQQSPSTIALCARCLKWTSNTFNCRRNARNAIKSVVLEKKRLLFTPSMQ